MKLEVLGYEIGTASGWDSCDDEVLQFYDFESSLEGLPSCSCITINYTTGIAQIYYDDGTEVSNQNLLQLILNKENSK